MPLALALLLASCGGGSTAGPLSTTTDAASVPAATTPAPSSAAPATTATTPAPAPTAPGPQTAQHARSSGGAAAPTRRAATTTPSPDTPAAAAGERDSTPATTAPATTEQPTTPRPAPDPQPAGSPLDETADLTLVNRVSPAHYFQQGTVTGTYDGTMEVEARITSKGVIVRFTATLPGGTISGRGIAVAILDSATWPGLRGTAAVTGGTGRFAGIHGRRLKVTGRARPDASKARVRVAGTVEF